jgi:hypothetical protein
MLIYRLISWLMLAAIGWVVFFFMFRAENHLGPEEALPEPSPPSDDERTT